MPTRAALVLAAGLVPAAGCGGPAPPLAPVRGTVVAADGRPAAGALVMFHPVGGPPAAMTGVVGPAGDYRLTTHRDGDGAPPGEYVVTLVWHPPRRTPLDPPADKLRGRYADKARSVIRFTVGPGDNVVPPIVLK